MPEWLDGITGLLGSVDESLFGGEVPRGAEYTREDARTARTMMLGQAGAALLAASQRGPVGQRAQYLATLGQAPVASAEYLQRAGQQNGQRQLQQAQIARLRAQTTQGQALANALRGQPPGAEAPPGAAAITSERLPSLTNGPAPAMGGSIPQISPSDGTPESIRRVQMEANAFREAVMSANLTQEEQARRLAAVSQAALTAMQGTRAGATYRVADGRLTNPDGSPATNPDGTPVRPFAGVAAPPPGMPVITNGGVTGRVGAPANAASPTVAAAPPPPAGTLTPAQTTLARPGAGGYNGNTLENMPAALRQLAAAAAESGDIDGARNIITGWMTRAAPNVQTVTVNGQVREMRPDGTLGQNYGDSARRDPVLSAEQLTGLGVPPAAARTIAGLAGRDEQDRALAAFARPAAENEPTVKQEDGLRSQFLARPQIVRIEQSAPLFTSIMSTTSRIREANARGEGDRLADLDLVVSLANLYDPGSVVREGEVANVQRAQALPDFLVGQLNRVNGGQGLLPEMLSQIERSAIGRLRSYAEAARPVQQQYRQLAERRGLNPDSVVLPADDLLAPYAGRGAPTPPAGPPVARPPNAGPETIARYIKQHYSTPAARREAAEAAGIDPNLVR